MSPSRKTPDRKQPGKADTEVLKDLMFGRGPVKRFTQDSPVMPDVWLEYGKRPGEPVDLLLTPHIKSSAGELFRAVLERLNEERKTEHWKKRRGRKGRPNLAYNQSTVVASLRFDELLRAVLPLTSWWQTYLCPESEEDVGRLLLPENRDRLALALEDPERGSRDLLSPARETGEPQIELSPLTRLHLPDLLWVFRIVGALAGAQDGKMEFVTELPAVRSAPPDPRKAPAPPYYRGLVDAVAELITGFLPFADRRPLLYSVNRNRDATLTIARSALAIKADAARLLFSVSCRDLAWAVIDSGIDATHPAFRLRHPSPAPAGAPPREEIDAAPFPLVDNRPVNRTRIVATYDFTRIRDFLNPSRLAKGKLPETLRKRYERGDEDAVQFVDDELPELKRSLLRGREIKWDLLEPLLRVPHEEGGLYQPPTNDHGTHVAGILAADWRPGDPGRAPTGPDGAAQVPLAGMCPDLRLYDFRVLGPDGRGDEFAVIAALQFVRHLNAHKDYIVLHGANLSLSMYHDVSNYACGSTPVCEECERLLGSGVVVVAAAGNLGWRKRESLDGGPAEGYSPISITDPGNTEGVITVGSTHRFMPHTYGVSYFSSRGPTGDGRAKPDLVAPGEKIEAPVPGGESRLKDGTSMAAPHVSGAAALLIARHRELAGKPKRIKQILCATATDLGREKYFQGAGMVDALRALQSV